MKKVNCSPIKYIDWECPHCTKQNKFNIASISGEILLCVGEVESKCSKCNKKVMVVNPE